jgi:hypothetical protein
LDESLKISELHLVRLGKVDEEFFEARVENLGKNVRDLLSQQNKASSRKTFGKRGLSTGYHRVCGEGQLGRSAGHREWK